MSLTVSAGTSRAVTTAPGYQLRYPDLRPPDADVFLQLEPRVCELESVTPKELENMLRTRILVTPDNKVTIIAVVGRELWRSSRDFAKKLGLPETLVLDVMCDEL
jgi:hypothetical protein